MHVKLIAHALKQSVQCSDGGSLELTEPCWEVVGLIDDRYRIAATKHHVIFQVGVNPAYKWEHYSTYFRGKGYNGVASVEGHESYVDFSIIVNVLQSIVQKLEEEIAVAAASHHGGEKAEWAKFKEELKLMLQHVTRAIILLPKITVTPP